MIPRHIEEKATSVLLRANCTAAPVDVVAISKALNIKLEEFDLEDEISGLFVVKQGKAHIGYNKHHADVRQRFTVAHEIGHFILHSKETVLFVDREEEKILYRNMASSSGEYQKEREANAFAAALLMPKNLLIKEIQGLKLKGALLVPSLTKKFKVSEEAMTIRLTNLGLIDYGLF